MRQLARMGIGIALALACARAGTARADTFGGFSGVDKPYLVSPDRVCAPLAVSDGVASGAPVCDKAAGDVIAKLSIKAPAAERGAKATFSASASGRTLTVASKTGGTIVRWEAPDPIARVVEVYASQYGDRVAVAYASRRAGREVVDVVAFELVGATKPQVGAGSGAGSGAGGDPRTAPPTPPGTSAPDDPALAKAIDAARKAGKGKARAAWQAVRALDADASEARYRLAALAVAAKQPADALAELGALASSGRADAIEWLVEARFDPAFAALRGDAKFRAAVGLDRKARTAYERLMGFGGQWLQNGTSCDKAEIHLTVQRDRVFKLRVKTSCQGATTDGTFKGTWRLDGDKIVLVVPTKGKAVTAADESPCQFEQHGDEDGLRCVFDRDLDFFVLPTRR